MPTAVGLWGGVACLFGFHVRSRGQARATPDGWVTRCARCAIPMARAHGGGKWQAVKTPTLKKRGDLETANQLLGKAMVKSRKSGTRRDQKLSKAMLEEARIAALPFDPVLPEEAEVEAPAKRRLFRRKRAAKAEGDAKPKRRFAALRRKEPAEAGGIVEPAAKPLRKRKAAAAAVDPGPDTSPPAPARRKRAPAKPKAEGGT